MTAGMLSCATSGSLSDQLLWGKIMQKGHLGSKKRAGPVLSPSLGIWLKSSSRVWCLQDLMDGAVEQNRAAHGGGPWVGAWDSSWDQPERSG